jgi:hypothetical protein
MSRFVKPLIKVFPKIIEINEIVGEYELSIDGVDKTLKVKILKMNSGEFMGIANLEVKGKGCGSHYRSIRPCNTKEEALEDAVDGFFRFFSEEADVKEVEEW